MSNEFQWLDRFISEKGIDREYTFEVMGDSGVNLIPIGVIIDSIKSTGQEEKDAIKDKLVLIDFYNGNVLDFFKHLAQAIAK